MHHRPARRSIKDCTVLIVDDQTSSRLVIATLLQDIVTCVQASNAREALDYCAHIPPDLILMDVFMPEMDGHEACALLSLNPKTQQIPVVFVTGSVSDEEQEKCWNAGGVDFVQKPVNATTLINRVKSHLAHKLKTDLLEQLIYTDRLTGCFNRHYLEERLPDIVRDANRDATPLSIAIFDIDFFKQFNDEYGHIEGDTCLWKLAKALKESLLRPMDRLIRIGGEEFMIILPDTNEAGAKTVCERILVTVDRLQLKHNRSPTGMVTVSAGAATFSHDGIGNIDEVVLKADQCLYKAKENGRNTYAYISEAGVIESPGL
ncbi:diguanylate cyclase [Aestuariibacter sp. A3R04]|uniref:GGDEF domain-containing response regulator n=1 Tax=Aestuariibacter sp. A3R04 TaxID=2841571 RepID=UPI001C0A5C31|nr:diguanylate cyclase [Aestuariibacter sp. A3R04]MBU3024009.1 diguanylate cyclase [Aestuariibacter sp. A3R04]